MAVSRLAQLKSTISSSSSNDPFVYSPLSDSAVRLLKVLSIKPEISVALIDYQIQDVPDYHAVSYSWGTEDPTAAILCNTRSFRVTHHLYEGLRCISTAMGCQTLWIDAICINQHDDAEKAQQVAKMHQIYVRAKGVLVWLGKAENDSDYALSRVSRFSDKRELSVPDTFKVLTRPSSPYIIPEFDGRSLLALWHLFSRSWFRRLWTYQEAVLANAIFLICGLGMVDWPTLAKVATTLTRTNRISYVRPLLKALQNPQQLYERGPWVDGVDVEKVREHRAKNRSLNFIRAVQHCRLRETTEAVDRIYGLLGLCEGPWSAYNGEIPIDYSDGNKARYWNLYAQFGKLVLIREPNLALLKMTTSRARPKDLPSWCPNLHSPPDSASIPGSHAAGWPSGGRGCAEHELVEGLSCTNVHPAYIEKSSRFISVSSSSSSISIWGAPIDVVATVGARYPLPAIPNMASLPVIREFAKRLMEWVDDSVHLIKAAANVSSSEILEAAATLHHNTAAARQLNAYHLTARYGDWLVEQDVANWPRRSPFSNEELSIIIENVSNLSSIWPGRAVFTTTKGRIGLASSHVTRGDKLCALYTGPTVYLLRKHPDRDSYEFISDGFVHGIMRGEVFELMHQGEVHEQLFVIE
jgi:Heterokaryon incompatibility protein (HET)